MGNTATGKIRVIRGDVTKMTTDAIVNAANSSLMGGGGVDGAIHRAGGPAILEECKRIVEEEGECETGEAVVTTAGNMPSKYVIHTVGPVWRGGEEDEENLLYNAYYNSLLQAAAHDCRTVAFPNISTGIYGYPKEDAAEVAVRAIKSFLSSVDDLEEVVLVCFDEENYELTRREVEAG